MIDDHSCRQTRHHPPATDTPLMPVPYYKNQDLSSATTLAGTPRPSFERLAHVRAYIHVWHGPRTLFGIVLVTGVCFNLLL